MKRRWIGIAGAFTALSCLFATGCRDLDTLEPARASTEPLVFDDDFSPGVDFQVFGDGAYLDALSIETLEAEVYSGTAALRVTVPAGGWSGGTFTTNRARDLSPYNALTLYARASVNSDFDVMGLGIDNTGTSKFTVLYEPVPLRADRWSLITIPIPNPSVLIAERGLFFFAESAESPEGHTVWIDEVRFSNVDSISNPRPVLPTRTYELFGGAEVDIEGCKTTFRVGSQDQVIQHLAGHFTFTSTNPSVATVENGVLRALGQGSATLTATLNGMDVPGELTVFVTDPPPTAAPDPVHPAASVISLFSDAYDDVTVDKWSADWDRADYTDIRINGNNTKVYTNLSFAGIEFISETLDISSMTTLHMDVWLPEGTFLKVKLVDFGADGVFGGAPDNEHEITLNADSDPAVVAGQWVSLEIPISKFVNLITREHLAQMILSSDSNTLYIDNIYFHP